MPAYIPHIGGDTRDGKFHEIKVRVDGHKNVRARNGYRFTARP